MPKFDDFDPAEQLSQDGTRLSKTGRRLIKQGRADSFRCLHCGAEVSQQVLGSQNRNHCPFCLWSRHVDQNIGDRRSTCLALMRPLGLIEKTGGGELALLHHCEACGQYRKNRLAGDDSIVTIEKVFVESVQHRPEIEKQSGFPLCTDWVRVKQALIGAQPLPGLA